MPKHPILAIDLDDTIFRELSEEQFPEVGPLFPKAKEAINSLYDQGYYIIIWTCRSKAALHLAEEALVRNQIKYHALNRQSPSIMLKYGSDTRKISADLYIDNKQLGGLPTSFNKDMDTLIPDWDRFYLQITTFHNTAF